MLNIDSPVSLKKRIQSGLHSTFYWSGLAWGCSHLAHGPEAVILMYHSITDEDDAKWIDHRWTLPSKVFEKQMKFLATYRNVMSLSSLLTLIKQNDPIPWGTVVITFDDGYRNILLNAAPILKKYSLPATIFLATGLIDRGENMWVDELYSCFLYRTRHHLNATVESDLSQPNSLREAYLKLSHLMIDNKRERTELLFQIKNQLKPYQTPSRLLLNWEEVKTLKQNAFFEVGGHTHDHLNLDNLALEKTEEQIVMCKKRIEEELEAPMLLFSYPYSKYSERAKQILDKCKVIGAVGDRSSPYFTSGRDPNCLSRIDTKLSKTQFQLKTSGIKLKK